MTSERAADEFPDPIDSYGRFELQERFTETMIELVLCSAVRAPLMDANKSGPATNKPGGSAPKGYNGSVESGLIARWRGCNTDEDRRMVLRDALKELHEIRYSPAPEQKPGTLEWKRAVGSDERSVLVVARVYRISPRTVRKHRRAWREGKLNR